MLSGTLFVDGPCAYRIEDGIAYCELPSGGNTVRVGMSVANFRKSLQRAQVALAEWDIDRTPRPLRKVD